MKFLLYLLLTSPSSDLQPPRFNEGDTLYVFFMNQYDDDSVKIYIPGKKPSAVKLKTIESLGACKKGIGFFDNLQGKEISFEHKRKGVKSSVAIKEGYRYLYVYFLGNNFEFRFEKERLQLE